MVHSNNCDTTWYQFRILPFTQQFILNSWVCTFVPCSGRSSTKHHSCQPLTFHCQIHPAKSKRAHKLGLHFSLTVDKDGGEVLVRVVWDASGGDAPQHLGWRELGGQRGEMLVDQSTQRNSSAVLRKWLYPDWLAAIDSWLHGEEVQCKTALDRRLPYTVTTTDRFH